MDNSDFNYDYLFPEEHMVLLYDDELEVINNLVPYIADNLKKNKKCIYITNESEVELVKQNLKLRLNFQKYIENKQFCILTKSEAYSKNGKFEPDQMIAMIIEEVNEAIENNFDGLSISGELSWVLDYDDGFDKIMEYEWKLNSKIFSNFPVSAICRYNLNKFTDNMIINIIQVHPFIIWKNRVHENPFFIPAEAFEKNKVSKYQVDTWLKNISKFTDTKSKFHTDMKEKETKFRQMQMQMTNEIILVTTQLLGIHNEYTKNHSENVANTARRISIALGMPSTVVEKTYYAGLVHDIGKTLISSAIIDKKGKLTDTEWDIIKQHPTWGYESLSKSSSLEDIAEYVLHHHERWDGKGYPDGLSGYNIPLVSRILSIADTYDAMTHERAYRKALSHETAINEIIRNSGTQFDSHLVNSFINNLDTILLDLETA